MKLYIRQAIRYTAIVMAIVLVGLGLAAGPLIVGELLAQGRVDRVFWNELCNGMFTLGNSAKLLLGTADGGSSGATVIYARNLSGLNVGPGRAMIWRAPITAVASVGSVAGATATIADDLVSHKSSSETIGCKYVLVAQCISTGTIASGDSVVASGWDANGATQTIRKALTAGSATNTMLISGTGRGATKYYWTKLTSASMSLVTGTTTVALLAYPVGGVDVAASGTDGNFAGVSVDSMASNAKGRICIEGPVDARVNGATLAAFPGRNLTLAGWGGFVTTAVAEDSNVVADAMEYGNQDSLLIRVKLGRQ